MQVTGDGLQALAKQRTHWCGVTSAVPPSWCHHHTSVPRCPVGYTGLSCQRCAANFERVQQGPYLGTCSGCSCHGHSSTCDQVFGHCLVRTGTWGQGTWGRGLSHMAVPPTPMPSPQNCQHNTEGPQCEKCKPGFFGDATQGTATACRPCPCPYTEPARRWVLPQEVWGGLVAHHGPMSPSPHPQVLRVVLPGHRWPGHLRRLRPRLCWPPLREVGGQGVVKR